MNVLITGAARGIGAESARRLAAKGHRLALVGLEPAELEAVSASCGNGAFALEADVTDGAAIEGAIGEAADRLGGRHLRESMRGPFKKTHPVGRAADAVVAGVEGRRRIVVAPRWVRAFHPVRGVLQRAQERDLLKIMPELERIDAEDRARRGAAANAPVDAGGAAAG